MEETLGKRIVRCRKNLGLTQDALAEQLGITAQAVSKWENDQSCPDITMLPRLAQVFGTSTDMLLGVEPIQEAETPSEEAENQHAPEFSAEQEREGVWEIQYNSSRRTALGIAVWLLLAGLAGFQAAGRGIGLWGILWSAGLLTYGLFGLYPKFSIFRLGCAVLGWFFLLDDFVALHIPSGLLLPAFLLLAGLYLLADSLKKPRKGSFHVHHSGKYMGGTAENGCDCSDSSFVCRTGFGSDQRFISLPRLDRGEMQVSFGSLVVDLSGCGEIAPGCTLEAGCSFGNLELLVPGKWRVEPVSRTAFAAVETEGQCCGSSKDIIKLYCSANFAAVTIRYI